MSELKGTKSRLASTVRWGQNTAPNAIENLEGRTRGGSPGTRQLAPALLLIVGGGQGGIALAARLRQLNVPTIIVEKNQKPGDSWRKRYKSLCLHDPVWYDHLPICRSRGTGRCSRRRTRSGTGSKCTAR